VRKLRRYEWLLLIAERGSFRLLLVLHHQMSVLKVTAAFLLGLPVEFRWFAQCALSEEGTLKVDKLDRLPLLHIHRNQSKVRTTLRSCRELTAWHSAVNTAVDTYIRTSVWASSIE
jgi:hypothetical protein